jgi:hypothetical protein
MEDVCPSIPNNGGGFAISFVEAKDRKRSNLETVEVYGVYEVKSQSIWHGTRITIELIQVLN